MSERSDEILEAAILLAQEKGLRFVTRDGVAERARVSTALVNRYFGTIGALRDRIILESVRRELLPILAQALIDQNPIALRAPRQLRQRAALSINE
jgi:AcrR family transcriptional regulator